jgi:toxin-antitoxin system PIN domain toxin
VNLIDTNLLIYATFTGMAENVRVRGWLQEQMTDAGAVLCWPVLYGLLRLITNSRVAGSSAISVQDGWAVVGAYLAQPAIRLVASGSGHAAIAAELARTPGLRSDDVPDIEIAALAIEHGLTLATHDHGFRRFSHLRVVDPLL